MQERPLTQREIRARKKQRQKVEYVTLYNPKKMALPLQLSAPPGWDFYTGEQTVQLKPKERSRFPAHRLMKEQIINLEKKGLLKVMSGHEHLGKKIT